MFLGLTHSYSTGKLRSVCKASHLYLRLCQLAFCCVTLEQNLLTHFMILFFSMHSALTACSRAEHDLDEVKSQSLNQDRHLHVEYPGQLKVSSLMI